MNKRHLIISAGAPTLDDNPKLCAVRVVEDDPSACDPLRTIHIVEDDHTIHFNGRVNYGLPITNIMEEWDCYELRYTPSAREKFLGKKLDPSLLT